MLVYQTPIGIGYDLTHCIPFLVLILNRFTYNLNGTFSLVGHGSSNRN